MTRNVDAAMNPNQKTTRRPRSAWVAWSLWALSLILTAGAMTLLLLMLDDELPADQRLGLFDAVGQVALLAFPTIGALVASRRPENRVGWLFCFVGVVWATYVFADAYTIYTKLAHPDVLPGGTFTGWLSNWLSTLAIFSTAIFLLLLFPNGHLLSARWRWVAWLSAASVAGMCVFWALSPGPLSDYSYIQNPIGITAFERVLDIIGVVANLLVVILVLVAAASTVLRFRRAQGDEREQLKWFAFSAALVGLAFVVAFTLINLSDIPSIWIGLIVVTALIAIPISTGIAILRYRLYDIDLIINRTLVYTLLSLSLALSYWVSIILLQQLFEPATRGSEFSVAASTLFVAALFQPVRSRVQSQVDRRFYRHKYDTAQTIEAFSTRLRSEIDLTTLADELRTVVQETMQPAHVSLWLRSAGAGVEARAGAKTDTRDDESVATTI